MNLAGAARNFFSRFDTSTVSSKTISTMQTASTVSTPKTKLTFLTKSTIPSNGHKNHLRIQKTKTNSGDGVTGKYLPISISVKSFTTFFQQLLLHP